MFNHNVINQRVKVLISRSNKSRESIAKSDIFHCDTSTITKHCTGDRNVSSEFVAKYAEYFGVSADYLLGLSDTPSANINVRAICDYVGLSEKAIEILHKIKMDKNLDSTLVDKFITEGYLEGIANSNVSK